MAPRHGTASSTSTFSSRSIWIASGRSWRSVDQRPILPARDATVRPGYFLEPRRSCSRGPLLLILCRDARRSRGVGGAAVPFAHIAYCRERVSPTATGGCEESAAAQARDVHGLAALDDRAPDEMHGFVADDGDAGAASQPMLRESRPLCFGGTGRASAFCDDGGHELAA